MEDQLDRDALLKLTSTQDKRNFGIVKRKKLKHQVVVLYQITFIMPYK
jgi:hypothetical protein